MAEKNDQVVDDELLDTLEGEDADTLQGAEGDDTLEGGEGDDSEAAGVPSFYGDAPSLDSDEVPEGQESSVIKALREKQREDAKRIAEEARLRREAEERLRALEGATQKPIELGAKPTREEFDYDEQKYDAALDAWYQRKSEVEASQRAAEQEKAKAAEAFKAKQERYLAEKKALPVDDFDAAEAAVTLELSKEKQAMLIDLADKPQHLIYALGKSPARLKELASLPIPQFIKRIGALETQMKMQTRKSPPPPASRPLNGGGVVRASASKRLDQLKAAAEKTGDYSAYHAARREIKAA